MATETEVRLVQEIERLKRQVERLKVGEVGGSWVYLTAPLTSTAWDGDSFSSVTTKTLLDMSSAFGIDTTGIKAYLLGVSIRDSGAASSDCWIMLSNQNDDNNTGLSGSCMPVSNRWGRYSLVVPCNADGDIYYRIAASGSNTFDVYLGIYGYWL